MKRPAAQARRSLDARLEPLREVAHGPAPHRGWIRAIRDALGMSTADLAARMGVVQSRVSAIERAEASGSIKLDTLRRAAEALGCDLVYVLVPRMSLGDMVRAQARRKASSHLEIVGHHMRLEDQSIDEEDRVAAVEDLAERLVDRRGLWSDTTTAR